MSSIWLSRPSKHNWSVWWEGNIARLNGSKRILVDRLPRSADQVGLVWTSGLTSDFNFIVQLDF